MPTDVCQHLRRAREFIDRRHPVVVFRGQAWERAGHWIQYDAALDATSMIRGLELDRCVVIEELDDCKNGSHYGLLCTSCRDALIGIHPQDRHHATALKIAFVAP
jgi:hypothetical protein